MKVFVGTMESGEEDFSFCKDSIKNQADVEITHYIISNLSEKEAHEALFSKWNEIKNEYDLFLKVDADTVLMHDKVIKNFIEIFQSNNKITGIQAWLHDYMTDDLIFGLNCLKNNVKISTKVNSLYPDRVDTGHDIVIRGNNLPKELIPAGKHCWHASNIQGFHYGLHRKLKNQNDILTKVKQAWNKNQDSIRAYAIIGSEMAHAFSKNHKFNYNDEDFKNAFNEAKINFDSFVKKFK